MNDPNDACECDHIRADHPVTDCDGCLGCDEFVLRSFGIAWSDRPTLDEAKSAFEEQDRWLAVFIFNNFGEAGLEAIKRLYDRVRK